MNTARAIILALALALPGCSAFRRDVSDVSVYGGYSDAQGDNVNGGVRVGIRPPVDHSK